MVKNLLKYVASVKNECQKMQTQDLQEQFTLQDNEALIAVYAAGVSRADIMQKEGNYPPPKGASPIIGLEIAGVVVEEPRMNSDIKKNMKVIALVTGGGYASFCKADCQTIIPLPENWSFEEGAGFAEVFFTVWKNIVQIAKLKKNEIFLTHAGASGVGMAAIQTAKIIGAIVIAVAGSDEKKQFCLKNGADFAINYKNDDFVQEVKKIVKQKNAKGVDVILDMIGGDYIEKNISIAAEKARIISIAAMKDYKVTFNIIKMMRKQITITGSTLRADKIENKAVISREIKRNLMPYMQNKYIIPHIDSVFLLENAEQAHQKMIDNKHMGKIILNLQKYHETTKNIKKCQNLQ